MGQMRAYDATTAYSSVARHGSQVSGSALHRKVPTRWPLSLFSALLVHLLASLEIEGVPFCLVGECAQPAQPDCTETPGKTTCRCVDNAAKSLSATISETRKTLELQCPDSATKYAPDGLKGANVCAASTQKLTECHNCNPEDKCMDVNELLSGTEKVKWKSETPDSGNGPRTLTVPKDNLPYVDQQFKVGCLDTSGETEKCSVTVELEARKTSRTNNTVTCAYGKESNEAHETITLNPANNSFTLLCGTDGEVLPKNYQANYCPVDDAQKDVSTPCGGDYKSILPEYGSTWWSPETVKGGVTLAIPTEKFPEQTAKIRVGCLARAALTRGDTTQDPEQKTTVCNVDVTIEGTGSPSASASPLVPTEVVAGLSVIVWSGALASHA
uniref:SAG-related sequence SRS38C n=1 Tax=Besnoitia besnoiti TaxID=94643 RepID=A0A2A9ME95_BESBE|nr:SAG-related sequence SRS38C [Besnoitia besnoiti]PFH36838.1 SAG-related sequence SRS38C [Besnoitia besnoiti]